MVKCPDCKKEMKTAVSCTHPYIKLNGEWFLRDTSYYDVNKRCHDCSIVNQKGNLHHFGCDIERCPRCHGQLISCGCKKGDVSKTNPNSIYNKLKAQGHHKEAKRLKDDFYNAKKWAEGLDINKETKVWD